MAPKFGTSGLRGLAEELSDQLCAAHARAFLNMLGLPENLLIGRDLRLSSPRIAAAVAAGAASLGVRVVDAGLVPTPALGFAAIERGWPAIMITGSHIPAERNGLKFFTPGGEITRAEEQMIASGAAAEGLGGNQEGIAVADPLVGAGYLARYLEFFAPDLLSGMRIGVYQHASLARDLLVTLLSDLGARVFPLGRSEHFVALDTEAVELAERTLLKGWASEHRLDAVVSTDGDADRPLLTDAAGMIVTGDVLGVITAAELGAEVVVTPVTSSSMAEAIGQFSQVVRTRVGSPDVIAAMQAQLPARVLGYEANGGVLLGFEVLREGRRLAPLLTRDAILPILTVLSAAARRGGGVAALVKNLPARRTASGRLREVPAVRAADFLARLAVDDRARDAFFDGLGRQVGSDQTDGLRVTFDTGVCVHLRPSGTAPEFRVYVEAGEQVICEQLLSEVMARTAAALACGR